MVYFGNKVIGWLIFFVICILFYLFSYFIFKVNSFEIKNMICWHFLPKFLRKELLINLSHIVWFVFKQALIFLFFFFMFSSLHHRSSIIKKKIPKIMAYLETLVVGRWNLKLIMFKDSGIMRWYFTSIPRCFRDKNH